LSRFSALLIAAQQLCFAGYNWYQTYTGSAGQFTQNGTLVGVSTPYGAGVTSSSSGGGSLISSKAVPGGGSSYEVAMTLGIADSNATYTAYVEASSNTLIGSSTTAGHLLRCVAHSHTVEWELFRESRYNRDLSAAQRCHHHAWQRNRSVPQRDVPAIAAEGKGAFANVSDPIASSGSRPRAPVAGSNAFLSLRAP